MRPKPEHEKQMAIHNMRILLVEPDGMATEWRHKGGCQTQKKAATPKSYDLANI